jgi:hypothetical protein
MFPNEICIKLQSQWGESSSAMSAYCLCRVFERNNRHEFFIYAQDPMENDKLLSIERSGMFLVPDSLISKWELEHLYDLEGEPFEIDPDFRPMRADLLYKKLQGTYEN